MSLARESSLAAQSLWTRLSFLLLTGFTLALIIRLWPEWLHHPDLSHGIFMPVLFVLMLAESRSRGTPRYLTSGAATTVTFVTLLGSGMVSLAAAGLYATALGWAHALIQFLLTVSLVSLLGAGLVVFSSKRLRLTPCNWSAVVAIGTWLLCAPMPPGTYARLTLALQLGVSESVLHTLHLLGIAAYRTGNIIELAHGSVGVEEACSGVRSLLSCVFVGCFFSATFVRRPWARAVIIGLSAPLALAMNFFRSLILTVLTNSGVDVANAWHDITGYGVVAFTAILLAALALWLERHSPTARPRRSSDPISVIGSAPPASVRALSSTLTAAAALLIFFALNTRSLPRAASPIPDLLAALPAAPPGWQSAAPSDLYQFAGTLETPHLAQRTYTAQAAAGGAPVQLTLYLAYWPAGQSTVSRVAAHTPDACWPGSGWTRQTTPFTQDAPPISTRVLPAAEYRLFAYETLPQHIWFWHLFDGAPLSYQNPYSTRELLKLAWHYGFRRDGDQLFVRVSSNRPWVEIASTPVLQEFFLRLQPLGL